MKLICRDATNAADEVIAALEQQGIKGLTAYDRYLIGEAFDEGLLNGNDEATVDFEGRQPFSLNIIQEDHYDQHMDEEDKPSWDDMLVYVGTVPAYVWMNKV